MWKEIFSSNKQEIPINKPINYSSEDKNTYYYEKLNNFLDLKLYIISIIQDNQWMKNINFDECYHKLLEKGIDENMTKDQFLLILCRDYVVYLKTLWIDYFAKNLNIK